MKSIRTFIASCILGVVALSANTGAVAADQSEETGFYLGGSYGWFKVEDSDFEDENGFPVVFGGYQFLPFLGVEASYRDFGEYGGVIQAETDATSLALTGRLPLTRTFAVFAGIGPMWWETDVDAGPFSINYDGRELMAGAGMSFQITENLDFRANYEWVDVDLGTDDIGTTPGDFDSDLDMFSLGVKFEF